MWLRACTSKVSLERKVLTACVALGLALKSTAPRGLAAMPLRRPPRRATADQMARPHLVQAPRVFLGNEQRPWLDVIQIPTASANRRHRNPRRRRDSAGARLSHRASVDGGKGERLTRARRHALSHGANPAHRTEPLTNHGATLSPRTAACQTRAAPRLSRHGRRSRPAAGCWAAGTLRC